MGYAAAYLFKMRKMGMLEANEETFCAAKGGYLVRQNEAYFTLHRFAMALSGIDSVKSVHALFTESEVHVWVVLRERVRSARYAVYVAQLKSDPDFLLTLHFTDSSNTVPSDAERIEQAVI